MKVQKLLSLIRQSCERYEMIEEGDKIAGGVSGGKDSLTLLYHSYPDREDRHGREKGTQSLFPVCKASERGAGR